MSALRQRSRLHGVELMAGHSNCKGAESFGQILSVAAVREFARKARARLQTVTEQSVSFQDLNWRISESKTECCRLIYLCATQIMVGRPAVAWSETAGSSEYQRLGR